MIFKKPAHRLLPNGQQAYRWLWRVAVGILAVLIGVSLLTAPLWSNWYNVQSLDVAVRHSPSFTPVVALSHYLPGGQSKSIPLATRMAHYFASWFGHDDLGRSVFYRVLPAFLVSMAVGLSAACMAVGIGVAWGATAGLLGGHADRIMMRIVDVLYGLPYVLMVILLQVGLSRPLGSLLGGAPRANLVVLLTAIGAVSWLTVARVVRGQVLSLKNQAFVEAARTAGGGFAHILARHLLPNLWGPVAAYGALVVPQAILQESFLSFLGLGIQPPTPSLGRLAAEGVESVNTFVGYWWLIVFPCGTLILSLVSLNIVADAARDRFDRRSGAFASA